MFIYESVRFGESDTFEFIHQKDLSFPVHLHRCYEFVYVRNGKLSVTVDETSVTLGEGDLVLIFPNQLHSYLTETSSDITLCIFSPELVNEFYQHSKGGKQKEIVTRLDSRIMDFVLTTLPECKRDKLLTKACLYALCAGISAGTEIVSREYTGDMKEWHRLLTYLESHFAEPVTLQKISKDFGYEYRYFSRKTRHQLMISFPMLLNGYRINYACYLLQNSGKSITDIAYECGYKNMRTFNRVFLMLNRKTPSVFRKEQMLRR